MLYRRHTQVILSYRYHLLAWPRFKIPASVLMPIARILANSAKALCKVRGEIDVEFRDEANAADPYKVVVLVG
ncbi:hypothetical protein Tco_1199567 [Tanacetum coccineum]